MTLSLQRWLENGQQWQNNMLLLGFVNLNLDTLNKIKEWAKQAEALGFKTEARLCIELINTNNSRKHRAKLFSELIFRYDMIEKLQEINTLKSEYE